MLGLVMGCIQFGHYLPAPTRVVRRIWIRYGGYVEF